MNAPMIAIASATAIPRPAGAVSAQGAAEPIHEAIARHRVAHREFREAVHGADYRGAPQHLHDAVDRTSDAEADALVALLNTQPATLTGFAALLDYISNLAQTDASVFDRTDIDVEGIFGQWASFVRHCSAS